jgi:hypothetical protein
VPRDDGNAGGGKGEKQIRVWGARLAETAQTPPEFPRVAPDLKLDRVGVVPNL